MLTFDVEGLPSREDHFGNASLTCLYTVLDLLEKQGFDGIFFITASATERIREDPDLVKRLSRHEIGYHSSSHSIRPRIIEYTDVSTYEEAVAISLKRETSHVNPENGKTEGKGGILALRETFPRNNIVCFRAPFLAWSPPHLEALRELGIKFDFSACISPEPVFFRGLTFYPFPIPIDDCMAATFVRRESSSIFPRPVSSMLLRRTVTVLFMHPAALIGENFSGAQGTHRAAGTARAKFRISLLKLLLDRIHLLSRMNLIEVTSSLNEDWRALHLDKVDVEKVYWRSVWSQMHLYNYRPRFVMSHFKHFFYQDIAK